MFKKLKIIKLCISPLYVDTCHDMTSTLYPTLQSTPPSQFCITCKWSYTCSAVQCEKKIESLGTESIGFAEFEVGLYSTLSLFPSQELIVHVASSQPATENV